MKKVLLLLIIPFLSFGQINYETEIQPILNAQCIECHQGDATYFGGLNLTSYDNLMDGGNTQGGVVTTGLLEEYITTGYMPAYGSGNSLSETEINLIIQWISEGANYIENCNSDIDNDGICEDHCEEWSMTVIVDCECSFFNPNTYTVFFDTVYEESCELWEDCYCECYNDTDGDGICDEDDCVAELIPDCVFGAFVDPVCGCDGVTYSNYGEAACNNIFDFTMGECDEENVIIEELFNNQKLLKIIDFLGREINSNTKFQLHIYDDGSVEKKYLIK